jgi:hypothetical protein
MDKIIWQPEFFLEHDFKIYLDSEFARTMIQSSISFDRQQRMNVIGNDELQRRGINWKDPFHFHQDSCFIDQFYIGRNGVWLATDYHSRDSLMSFNAFVKPIEYHSHNVDTAQEKIALMRLVDIWVKYSEILRGEYTNK